MSVAIPIVNSLTSNNFQYNPNNFYTNTPAYVRRAKNIEANLGMKFYNCRILVEVASINYLTFRIVGYKTINDSFYDITRTVIPGAKQLITYHNPAITLRDLSTIVYPSRVKYAL